MIKPITHTPPLSRHELRFSPRLNLTTERLQPLSFLTCNESQYHKFRAGIAEASGWYVGVGSFQNYSLMGRHKYAVLTDIDPGVSVLHECGTEWLRRCEDRNAFLKHVVSPQAWEEYWETLCSRRILTTPRRWSPQSNEGGSVAESPEAKMSLLAGFGKLQEWCQKESDMEESFLGSDQIYAEARDLALQGRIKITSRDVLEDAFLKRLMGLAVYSGTPVSTMYLSNAVAWCARKEQFSSQVMEHLLPDNPQILMTTKPQKSVQLYSWLYWSVSARHLREGLSRHVTTHFLNGAKKVYDLPHLSRDTFVEL